MAITPDSIRTGTITADSIPMEDDVELPKALREPARRVGHALTAVLALAGAFLAIILPLADVVPEQYRVRYVAIVGVVTAAVAAATKVATELIRGKVTPAWKIRRVYEEWERSVHVSQEGDHAQPGPGDHVYNAGELEPDVPTSSGGIPHAMDVEAPGQPEVPDVLPPVQWPPPEAPTPQVR